jgi:ligand-binding sensor domain-containing protein/signal transduction histidine kinase
LKEPPQDAVSQNEAKTADTARWPARRLRFSVRRLRVAAQIRILAAGMLLGCGLAALALEPSTPLVNYGRQTWVMENGLPQNTVQALLQTRDGFVWLGTEAGLVRFDGNGFAVFDRNSNPALPGNDVRCLLETSNGVLWIGTSEGLAQWKNGTVTAFNTREGLPGNGIRALMEAPNEGLWVWTDGGLVQKRGGRFEAFGDWRPGSSIPAVTAYGGIAFWLGEETDTDNNVPWRQIAVQAGLAKEAVEFLAALPESETAVASKSRLVMARGGSLTMRLTAGNELPGSRIQAVFVDREGNLWIGTNGGLARWAAGKLQRMPVTDPLASASVLALMEDREGNLWAGTEAGGLHILRDQRFRTFGAREGLSSDDTSALVEDGAGTLWVGTSGSGLNAFRRSGSVAEAKEGAVKSYTVRDGLLSDVILSLAAAPNGDLWVGTPDGLNRIRRGSISSYTSADGLPDDFIRSLLADADGSLWIGTRRGLTHWTYRNGGQVGKDMSTFTQTSGLGSDLVGAMARDSNGNLWVATFAGLSQLHGHKITNYTTANGLSSNVITALLPGSNGALLIGTQDHGWTRWDGQRFNAEMAEGPNQTNIGIHAILNDEAGHIWFATGNGIARCDSTAELAGCSHWIEFGTADGLRSREMATNSHPSAWRSRDGHLWFATPKGLVEVDPAHFPVNMVPPPVALERFSVDDVDQALRGGGFSVEVPAGHEHFQFEYAGLSFAAPQKVRYRFMLEGFDRKWIEAGSRRTAYYTNIPPGHYTFRVQAANNDGLWNTEGAALKFELRPHFYRTIWFYALLLGVGGGMLALLLRLRLRRAEREFRAVLGERNRIAREIHDTLAQGYVGISVQMEVLTELLRLEKVDEAARHLDLIRLYIREGLADARQSIWALRSQDSGETTLPVRLRRMVEAAGGNGLESSFSIFGAYRPQTPTIEREFLRVAQEAINNVKMHSGAGNLFVQLEYGSTLIALEVRDDGRGFSSETEYPQGHYGITGMRERAEAIGGTLEVTSEPGVGTTVRLTATPRESRGRAGE